MNHNYFDISTAIGKTIVRCALLLLRAGFWMTGQCIDEITIKGHSHEPTAEEPEA